MTQIKYIDKILAVCCRVETKFRAEQLTKTRDLVYVNR